MGNKIKVIHIEDDNGWLHVIATLIKKDQRLEYAGNAKCKASGIDIAKKVKPDVVIMDLQLTDSVDDGIEAAKKIQSVTKAKIVFLTGHEQEDLVIRVAKTALTADICFKSRHTGISHTVYNIATSITPQMILNKELMLSDLTKRKKEIIEEEIEGNPDISPNASISSRNAQKDDARRSLGFAKMKDLVYVFRNFSNKSQQ